MKPILSKIEAPLTKFRKNGNMYEIPLFQYKRNLIPGTDLMGGYKIQEKLDMKFGESFGDCAGIDIESQTFWFNSGINSIFDCSQEKEDFDDFLREFFLGETSTKILGFIRRMNY